MVWQADHNESKEAEMLVGQMRRTGVTEFKAEAHEKLPIQLYIESISDGWLAGCSHFIHSCFIYSLIHSITPKKICCFLIIPIIMTTSYGLPTVCHSPFTQQRSWGSEKLGD